MTVASFGRERTAVPLAAVGAVLFAVAAPAAAQDAETPTRPIDFRLPPAEDARTPGVQGPSDNGLPPVAPGERSEQPTPAPAPAPTSPTTRSAVPPRVTPTQPSATPAPSSDRPAGTAAPRAAPSAESAAPPPPTEDTQALPPPVVGPEASVVSDDAPAEDTPPVAATPAPASAGTPLWAWLLAVLAAVAAGWWYWRRRPVPAGPVADDRASASAPPPSSPLPAAATTSRSAAPAPAPAASPTRIAPATPRPASPLVTRPAAEQRAIVAMALDIRTIRFVSDHVAVGFALNLLNQGPIAATGLMVRIALNQGSAMPESVLSRFFDGAGGSVLRDDMTLAPGAGEALSGEVMLPRAAIEPLMIGGKPMLVPVMAFDVTYHWDGEGDAFGQNAGSFVLGREQGQSGSDKLAPLTLGRAAYVVDRPGARATAMKRSQ